MVSVSPDFSSLPTFVCKSLASAFKPYPPNVSISYRPYTGGEVRRNSASKMTPKQEYMEVLNGITTEHMDKLDLSMADLLYIGLYRKIATLGASKYTSTSHCKVCGTLNKRSFEESDLSFDEITSKEYPVVREIQGHVAIFKILSVRKYFYLLDNNIATDEYAHLTIQSLPDEFTEEEFEARYKWFFNLYLPEDVKILNEIESLLYHGLQPIEVTCSKCKTVYSIELDGGRTFVRPFHESTDS